MSGFNKTAPSRMNQNLTYLPIYFLLFWINLQHFTRRSKAQSVSCLEGGHQSSCCRKRESPDAGAGAATVRQFVKAFLKAFNSVRHSLNISNSRVERVELELVEFVHFRIQLQLDRSHFKSDSIGLGVKTSEACECNM